MAYGGHFYRGFMTEEEKASQPKVTGALLMRVLPYSGKLLLVLLCIASASFCSLLSGISCRTSRRAWTPMRSWWSRMEGSQSAALIRNWSTWAACTASSTKPNSQRRRRPRGMA